MIRSSGSLLILIVRILVIVLLLVALYFGVRWVYEQFKDSNNSSQNVATDNSGANPENSTTVVVDENVSVSSPSNSGEQSSQVVSTPSQTNTTNSNSTPQSIPNTGPESLLTIFIGSIIVGAVVRHFVLVRNKK